MRNETVRLVTATLAAVTLSAGCSSLPGGGPEDMTAAVKGSAAALQEGNYSFTTTAPEITTTGVVHLPSRSATLTTKNTKWDKSLGGTVRLVGVDQFDTITGSEPSRVTGKNWVRLDLSKLRPGSERLNLDDPDLTGARIVLSGVESATQNGSVITGTLDGTKALAIVDARSRKHPQTPTEAEAAPLRSRPYQARLDDAGRLTSLAFDLPQFGMYVAGRWSIEITGYGASTPVQAPAASDLLDWGKYTAKRKK